MRGSKRRKVSFAFLLSMGPLLPAPLSLAQALGRNSQPGTAIPDLLVGRVVSGVSDAPVARALVQLGNQSMLTDQEGRFRFEQPGQPVSSIRVTKPGFSTGPEQNEGDGRTAVDATDPGSVTVTVWPEALLTGRVLAPDGEPLPHIAIQVRKDLFDEQGHRFQPSGQSQTDSHGQFRIPVWAGDYVVESQFSPRAFERDEAVLPASYPLPLSGASQHTVHLAPGQEEQIELHPQVSRTFAVTLPVDGDDGMPPSQITARSSAGISFSARGFRSGEAGAMRLNLPPGTYTLHATRFSRIGPQFGDSNVTVTDHDVTGAPLHFTSLPSIPLELVTDTSGPTTTNRAASSLPNLAQFNLVLEPIDVDPASPFQFGVRPTQQREGVLTLAVPPGTYRLSAGSASGWYIRSATSRGTDLMRELLNVSASSSPSPITIGVSDQTGALEGTVKLSGNPAACWIYLVSNSPSLSKLAIHRSDTSGIFRFADLAPGSYRAVAFSYRHSANFEDPAVLARYTTYLGTVTVSAGTTSSLDLDAVPTKEMLP